jgi:hypothetical protein
MGGKRGSGATHIRYAHVTRPTEIAVACPRCGGCALATQPSHALGQLTAGDCSREFGEPWSVACRACPFRATGLPWSEMRALSPLYFRATVAGVEIWAWNRDHLAMLVAALEGRPLAGKPYAYFSTYLRREWLTGSRRARFARAARAMLLRG